VSVTSPCGPVSSDYYFCSCHRFVLLMTPYVHQLMKFHNTWLQHNLCDATYSVGDDGYMHTSERFRFYVQWGGLAAFAACTNSVVTGRSFNARFSRAANTAVLPQQQGDGEHVFLGRNKSPSRGRVLRCGTLTFFWGCVPVPSLRDYDRTAPTHPA